MATREGVCCDSVKMTVSMYSLGGLGVSIQAVSKINTAICLFYADSESVSNIPKQNPTIVYERGK